jgi:creatinine amidohydrolase
VSSCRLPGTLDPLALKGPKNPAVTVNILETGQVRVLFHSWYNAPQTAAAADRFDLDQMHGGWVENFPWTRLPGVDLPAERARVVSRELTGLLGPAELRAAAQDGVMGGAYARPDEDMQAVWDAGVAEVRELLVSGWPE